MTSESARTLVAAMKALGHSRDPRELELVRGALLRGPKDLADELRLAMAGGEEAYLAFKRLAALVEAGGGSPFTLLDLCSDDQWRGRMRAV